LAREQILVKFSTLPIIIKSPKLPIPAELEQIVTLRKDLVHYLPLAGTKQSRIPPWLENFERLELFFGDTLKKEKWREIYNEQRPHSSLNYATPQAYRLAWEQRNTIQPSKENLSLTLVPK